MTAQTLRILLVACLIAMYLLAMLNLRRRARSLGEFIAWGIFATLVPLVGPFLTILYRPARPRRWRLLRPSS